MPGAGSGQIAVRPGAGALAGARLGDLGAVVRSALSIAGRGRGSATEGDGRSGAGAAVNESAIRARVEDACAGDPEAFGDLFRAFEPDVGRLCARLLGSPDEASDATHEAFLRAGRALERYDPQQPFRPWLLAIASHHCLDRLRRRRTERRIFDPGDLDPADLAGGGESPLEGRLRAEARHAVLAAVEALPDRYRAPLVLRYYAELDYDGIAEALDLSRSQVGTLLFRAKRRLRAALVGAGR